ncbi:MAG: DMT family transporter [Proteobacteria bacterium]|nr:DMT family transporter [Pseudomonadota bacterium]
MISRRALLDWSVLVALVVVWGSAFAGLKIAVGGLHPAWVASMRLSTAALALFILMRGRGERPPRLWPRPDPIWSTYALLGVFGLGTPFLLFSWAATELPSAVLAICNGVSPVFTALFAHAFLAGERLNGRKSVGVSLGLIGFIALVAPDLKTDGLGSAVVAELAALAGAALYAVANVVTKQAPSAPPVLSAFIMCLAGALATAAAALLWAGPPPLPGLKVGAVVVALGLLPTALGTVGYVWLIRRRGALFTSFTTYLAPVWAILIGIALLGERPAPAEYAALALILLGVGIANLRGKTVERPPSPAGQPA